MAINTSTGLRGKVGDRVYQKGRYGLINREYVIPKNPRTASQQSQRQIFGMVTREYRHLLEEHRKAWIAAGAKVEAHTKRGFLTGLQYYQSINVTRVTCGMEMTSLPPPFARFGLLEIVSLCLSESGLTLGLRLLRRSPEKLMVYATRGSRLGATTARKGLRLLGAFDPSSWRLAEEVYDAYTARFGRPVAGEGVEFIFKPMSGGHTGYAITRILSVTPQSVKTARGATVSAPLERSVAAAADSGESGGRHERTERWRMEWEGIVWREGVFALGRRWERTDGRTRPGGGQWPRQGAAIVGTRIRRARRFLRRKNVIFNERKASFDEEEASFDEDPSSFAEGTASLDEGRRGFEAETLDFG